MPERKLPCREGNYCVTEYSKHSGYALEPPCLGHEFECPHFRKSWCSRGHSALPSEIWHTMVGLLGPVAAEWNPQADPVTKSTELRWPEAVFSSDCLRKSCWVLKSSSLNPQLGRLDGFHKSAGSDVSYCDCSLIPACSIIFFSKLGFLSDDELANLELKCTPCFLRERKCSNFAFAAGLGDPGGDGGMSRLGIGGRVRS